MSEEAVKIEVPDYSDSEFLETAKEMGYVNPVEYEGDPPRNGWKSPEEFIKDTWKAVKGKTDKESAMERKINSMEVTMKQMAATQTKELMNQRQKIIAELEARRDEAIEEGDTVKFRQLDAEISKTRAEPVVEAPPVPTEFQEASRNLTVSLAKRLTVKLIRNLGHTPVHFHLDLNLEIFSVNLRPG